MSWNGGKSIKEFVDDIIADGKLTTDEKIRLQQAMMADGSLDDEEREQIRRLIDMLTDGTLEIVDE